MRLWHVCMANNESINKLGRAISVCVSFCTSKRCTSIDSMHLITSFFLSSFRFFFFNYFKPITEYTDFVHSMQCNEHLKTYCTVQIEMHADFWLPFCVGHMMPVYWWTRIPSFSFALSFILNKRTRFFIIVVAVVCASFASNTTKRKKWVVSIMLSNHPIRFVLRMGIV